MLIFTCELLCDEFLNKGASIKPWKKLSSVGTPSTLCYFRFCLYPTPSKPLCTLFIHNMVLHKTTNPLQLLSA